MNQFAADFLEALLRRMRTDRNNDLPSRLVARQAREDFERDPTTITGPLEEALLQNNLALTPKGNLMATDQELCGEIKAMLPSEGVGVGAGFSWWSIAKRLLQLLQLLIPDDEKPALTSEGVGHAIGHVDDPFAAVMIAIDSTKELAERGCAACDVLWFASNRFLPHKD